MSRVTLDWNRVDGGDTSGWVAKGKRWYWVIYDHLDTSSSIWSLMPSNVQRVYETVGGFLLVGMVTVTPSEEELFTPAGDRRVLVERTSTLGYAKLRAGKAEILDPPVGWNGMAGLNNFED